MMMKYYIYCFGFFLIISFHASSGSDISEHQVDPHRFEEGRNQYELIKQRAELPAYGQCWLETLTSIHAGCKNVTDLVQSRLSLSYLNCFLEVQQRHNYPCPMNESIPACTKNMTEGDRASLATFFVHTQNICYFLEIKYWNQHTQRTIQRLSETSEDVVLQLEFSSRLQADMLTRQNITLKKQELILAQAVNLSHIISSSSSNIKETLMEFRVLSQEQRNSVNDVFERIAKLQSMFLGEISSLYSIVFYSMSMVVWFLFTSVPRTASARLPLFGLMSINWIIEKIIIHYKTAEVAEPLLGAYNDAELYELQWWCRKFHCLIGLAILVLFGWRYCDINAENNTLLKQIQDSLLNSRNSSTAPNLNSISPDQSQQKEPEIFNGNSKKKNISKFPNQEATLNQPNPNGIPGKLPQTVYIRSDERSDSSFEGVVTYRMVKAEQGELNRLTPASETYSTPNRTRPSQVHNNSGFEPDNVFLFPDIQSESTSYEEIARPQKLERASVPPRRPNPSTEDIPPLPSARCYSDSTLVRKLESHQDTFII